MTENMAWCLARMLDADMLRMPDHGGYAVGVTRQDGRYALLGDSRGALYAEETACLDDSSGGDPSEWSGWGRGEAWAVGLASLIGGQAHHRGDVWEVLYSRQDGQIAVIGAEQVELYESREHYAGCGKPEYLAWEWDV